MDDELGFSLPVPWGWYANDGSDGSEPCRLFNPDPVAIEDPREPNVAITLTTVAAGTQFGFVTEEEVIERRDLMIDGLPAERYLTDVIGRSRIYYLLGFTGTMPSDTNEVPYVVIATWYGDGTFERDRGAIDHIADGFRLRR